MSVEFKGNAYVSRETFIRLMRVPDTRFDVFTNTSAAAILWAGRRIGAVRLFIKEGI